LRLRLKRRSRQSRRVLVMGLSACAHLIVLLALGRRIPWAPTLAEGPQDPPMLVTILRPPPATKPRALPETVRAAPTPAASPTTPAPSVVPPPLLTQPAPNAPLTAPPTDNEQFRSALRGLVGCSDPSSYRLSREERAGCDRRLAAAKPAPVAKQFSAQELALFNADKQESILVRKPHNGCLPRLGDRPAPAAAAAPAGATTTVGLGCSWSLW
jgi:acetyl esterase/lipase